jgi:hypothetical protein
LEQHLEVLRLLRRWQLDLVSRDRQDVAFRSAWPVLRLALEDLDLVSADSQARLDSVDRLASEVVADLLVDLVCSPICSLKLLC